MKLNEYKLWIINLYIKIYDDLKNKSLLLYLKLSFN